MKSSLTPYVISVLKINRTVSCHYIPIRGAKTADTDNTRCGTRKTAEKNAKWPGAGGSCL
jgi:hypothetical protein